MVEFPAFISNLFARNVPGRPLSDAESVGLAVKFATTGDQFAAKQLARGWEFDFDVFDDEPADAAREKEFAPLADSAKSDLLLIARDAVTAMDRMRWREAARVVLVPAQRVFDYDDNCRGEAESFLVPESLDAALAYALFLIDDPSREFRADISVCRLCGSLYRVSERRAADAAKRGIAKVKGGPSPRGYCSSVHQEQAKGQIAREGMRRIRAQAKAAKHK